MTAEEVGAIVDGKMKSLGDKFDAVLAKLGGETPAAEKSAAAGAEGTAGADTAQKSAAPELDLDALATAVVAKMGVAPGKTKGLVADPNLAGGDKQEKRAGEKVKGLVERAKDIRESGMGSAKAATGMTSLLKDGLALEATGFRQDYHGLGEDDE